MSPAFFIGEINMQKTIEIDNKQVKLVSTAATPIIYRAQFGTDFFADLMKMQKAIPANKPQEKWTRKDMDNLDLMPFYQFLWATAKGADKKLPDLVDWLSEFDSLDISEVLPEIQDLIENSISGKKA